MYVGAGWYLPTWLTIASALGLAALLRRVGVGQLTALVAMAVGFVVVGGILLFPRTLLVVLPTPATLHAMAAATRLALRGMVDKAAPVEVTQEFLLVTCAGVWLVATAADGLAFRARQPLLAIVPALGLFIFPAVIRDANPVFAAFWFLLGTAALLLVESRVRLATWGQWVSSPASRPGTRWRLAVTPAASTARRLVLAAGLAALVLPFLLPGYGQPPLLAYRGAPSPDAQVTLNPFVSVKTKLTSQSNARLFTVEAREGAYWRLFTLDRFDGTTWTPSGPTDSLVPFTPGSQGDLAPSGPAHQLVQRFHVDKLAPTWLPAAPGVVKVDAGHAVLENPANRGLTTRQRLRSGDTYTVTSNLPDPQAKDLDRPQAYDSVPELAPYRDVTVDPGVRQLTNQVTGRAAHPTPFQQALAIQDYLRNPAIFKYNLNVPSLSQGGDQLKRFLLQVRQGYCEQFASAMAAMARVAGIPARVAVGFTPGAPANGRFEITGRDTHAWPELYFLGVGWVRFEPTPRSDQVVLPAYTTPLGRVAAGAPGAATASTLPSGGDQSATQGTLPRSERQQQPTDAPGSPATPPRRNPVARPAVWLPLVLVLLALLVPAAKGGRHLVARRRAGRRPRDAVAAAYVEATDWAGDAGIGRRRAETPAAYARRIAAAYDAAAAPLLELTGLYQQAEYAPATPGPDQAHRARRLARAARRRLAARLGWRRRLGAALSPHSLLAPRPVLKRRPSPAAPAAPRPRSPLWPGRAHRSG